MEKANKSVFDTLYAIDAGKKIRQKGKLSYVSWSDAWAEIKKIYPDATFKIYPQVMDENGNERFWHDDGKTGWVEVGVTINNEEIREVLAIMDFRNQSIPAENITSVEANKALKRCLTKACALHGLFLFIYSGEDIPEELAKTNELKEKVDSLAKKKAALSDKAKEKVASLCKDAQRKAFPETEEEFIDGNYKNIEDSEILDDLYKKLLTVRK